MTERRHLPVIQPTADERPSGVYPVLDARGRLREAWRKRATRDGNGLGARAVTINPERNKRRFVQALMALDPLPYDPNYVRPKTRGDCYRMPRPCRETLCPHHLATDVNRNGSVKFNFPDLDITQMQETCALDVADKVSERRRPMTLHGVGRLMNITGPRVLDDDNLSHAFKKHRDTVANSVGVDDGDESFWTWRYAQEKGSYGVRVRLDFGGAT